jgi:hypothetical protein
MAHELIHYAGKGGHASAYKCLDEPSNTLKCAQACPRIQHCQFYFEVMSVGGLFATSTGMVQGLPLSSTNTYQEYHDMRV